MADGDGVTSATAHQSHPTTAVRVCRGLFITGTDTGVGKTHVASMILRQLVAEGHSVGAYKPVCSGAEDGHDARPVWDDLERLRAALGLHCDISRICRQTFLAPLAPPIAARREGRSVSVELIDAGMSDWRRTVEHLVVEGAGGWLCPLTETITMDAWVARWKLPVLIVARPGLGTINHTLLTIASIRARGLRVVGVVFNHTTSGQSDVSTATNREEIEARSGVPVLAEVRHQQTGELQGVAGSGRIRWPVLMAPISERPGPSAGGR